MAFAASEVAQASDRLKQELRRAVERVSPVTAVTQIAAALPGLDTQIRGGLLEARKTLETPSSLAERDDPSPVVLFRGFGDSSLNFEVRFWANAEHFPAVESQAVGEIYARLAEAGLQIPFPQRDLHLRSIDPALGATDPDDENA